MRDVVDAQQHGARQRIESQVVEKIAKVDIRHVAERREQRKPDAASGRPIEHQRHQRAGLADEGEVARPGPRVRVRGIEAKSRHHHAEAGRSHDPQTMRLRRVQHALPECRARGRPGAIEPRRDHHHGAGAARAEVGDQARHVLRRRGDDGEIGDDRQVGDGAVGEHTVHCGVARMYRHDRSVEAAREQVSRQHPTHRTRRIVGADERDRSRPEQGIESGDGH